MARSQHVEVRFRTGQRTREAGLYEIGGFTGPGPHPKLKPRSKRRPIRMDQGATFPPYCDRGVWYRPFDAA